MTVEFGPGGSERVEVGEGDFICIPAHLIHRESVAPGRRRTAAASGPPRITVIVS
jgi:mannose-6-phosphate isomerase-like protein (cupin superfamily)